MKLNDLSVDLETLSASSDAMIVSIGAIRCDFETGETGDTFYEVIDVEQYGGDAREAVNGSTLKWWMKQSDAARAVFNDLRALPLELVLDKFRAYIGRDHQTVRIWGNGSDFDNVILANLYKSFKQVPPWDFFNNRCYRTLKSMVPAVRMARKGTHHNALDDAISQAEHAIAIHKHVAAVTAAASIQFARQVPARE